MVGTGLNDTGTSGTGRDPYIEQNVEPLYKIGWIIAAVTLRGCDGRELTSPVMHHGGMVFDVAAAVNVCLRRFVGRRLYGIGTFNRLAPDLETYKRPLGTSLGGIMGGNFLGFMGEDCPLTAFMSLSAVLRLDLSAATYRTASSGSR